MLLFYIRHGKPTYDPDELTPLGKRQAEAVAKRLSCYGIDKVYSSTSNRALQTSIPTCEILGKEPEMLDFSNEKYAWQEFTVVRDDGKREWGYANADMRRIFLSDDMYRLGNRWYEHPVFEGTGFKEGAERIARETDEFLASLGYVHNREGRFYTVSEPKYDRVALFAHEGFGQAFFSALLDIPYPIYSTHFTMSHSGMSVVEFEERGGFVVPRVLELSCDAHLYAERLPTKYNDKIYI
ncbi:MAG: histidine phosphatase family protein [Eubacteriales bacterium]